MSNLERLAFLLARARLIQQLAALGRGRRTVH